MHQRSVMIAVALLMIGTAAPALAQQQNNNSLLPAGYGALTATLGVTSDYRFRGISQTDEDPALQGRLDWAHSNGIYVGAGASNVDFPDASLETEVYGGYTFKHGAYNFDAGLIGNLYPGADNSFDYDYYEGKLAVGRNAGPVSTMASVHYSPDFFAGSGDAVYTAFDVSAPVMDTGFKVSGNAGYQWIDDETAFGASDYADWSVGVGYTLYGFDMDLR